MTDRLAKRQEKGTELRAGIAAGGSALAGFLLVPLLLSQLGMNFVGAYTAFALTCLAGTLLMGFLHLPLLLMPSAAIGSSLVYLVGISQGISWQQLLGINFAAASAGMLLFLSPWGQSVSDAVPRVVRRLMPAGLGVMLIFLGLVQGRIVIRSAWSVTMLGNFQDPLAYWGLAGTLLTLAMLAMKMRGALLYGFVLTAVFALAEGFWAMPDAPFLLPEGLDLTAGQLTLMAETEKSVGQMAAAGLSLFVMLCCVNWGCFCALHPEKKRPERPLAAVFGIGVPGALLGSMVPVVSPLSAVGAMGGGRGRWTSLGMAAVFLLALFCEPLVKSMTDFPAMIVPVLVGTGALLLQETAQKLRREKTAWELPEICAAISLLLIMPLSGSISAGIGTAVTGWCFLTAAGGGWRTIPKGTWFLSLCFVMYFAFAVI